MVVSIEVDKKKKNSWNFNKLLKVKCGWYENLKLFGVLNMIEICINLLWERLGWVMKYERLFFCYKCDGFFKVWGWIRKINSNLFIVSILY